MKNFMYSVLGTIVGSIIYQVGLVLVVNNEMKVVADDLRAQQGL